MQATVFCFKAQILIWIIFYLFQLTFHLNFENLFDFTKVIDNRYGFLVGLHNFLTFQAFNRKQGEMLVRSQIFRYLAFSSRSKFFTSISIVFSLNQPVFRAHFGHIKDSKIGSRLQFLATFLDLYSSSFGKLHHCTVGTFWCKQSHATYNKKWKICKISNL